MKMSFISYRAAKIRALQAAADILADAAQDPAVFDEDELEPRELRASMFELERLATKMQKEAFRLEDLTIYAQRKD